MRSDNFYRKIQIAVTVCAIISFFLFVALWESRFAQQTRAALQRDAKIIEEDLWNFDEKDAATYLQTAAKLNNYQSLTLYDSNQQVFIQLEGPECAGICKLLENVGLIYSNRLAVPVMHNGSPIGELSVKHRHTNVFTYFYVTVVLLLALVAMKLFFRTLRDRDMLETRIRERTAELRKSQVQLSREKRHVDSIIHSMVDSVVVVNLDWKIEKVNNATCLLTGHSEQELADTNVKTILQPSGENADTPALLSRMAEEVKEKSTVSDIDAVYLSEAGDRIPISLTCSALEDFQDDVIAMVLVGRDMRGAKLVEKLSKAKRDAEAANRSKSAFLANMSHEIRTPMTAIIGLSEQTLKTELNAKQRNYVNKLHSSAENLLRILNDILDFSKIESGNLEIEQIEFSAQDIFSNIRNVLGMHARQKGLTLQVKTDPTVPSTLVGDPLRLGQVLLNLCSNAIKFTQEGGITVQMGVLSEDADATELQFSVNDSGIGVDEEKKQALFGAFSQADSSTSRKFGGSGLGLAISKDLVARMGGRIWMESKPGEGSAFHFTVKLKKPKTVTASSTNDRLPVPSASGLNAHQLHGTHVLLAEDTDINRELVVDLLADLGIRVTAVEDGNEAIKAARSTRFDGILMDLQMPNMDGFTAAQTLRSLPEFHDMPIIALSANVMDEDRQRASRAGMNDFLGKPIDVDQMVETLAKWLPTKYASATCVDETQEPDNPTATPTELPGVDMNAALKVYGGDQPLLENGLRLFLERFQDFEYNFRRAANDFDDQAATREAHTLKGAAANLGMHELREAAERLEHACQTEPAHIENRLKDLVESLDPVREGLRSFIET